MNFDEFETVTVVSEKQVEENLAFKIMPDQDNIIIDTKIKFNIDHIFKG